MMNNDSVAEWSRRWTLNPICAGSIPARIAN